MKAMQKAESGDYPWINERGERFGNKRKAEAESKVRQKRVQRAKNKRDPLFFAESI